MILSETISTFRSDNPEITDRVASDALVKVWCGMADKETCAIARCIVTDEVISSVVSTSVYSTRYDLVTNISNFYDIDDFPGGGVSFDDDPLEKTTVAELDQEDSSWRERSAGTPDKYYRRGKWLYFDRPVETASLEIRVYAVLLSDDWTEDNTMPFNQLAYLEPFHPAILLYLKWKAKQKIGETGEAQQARQDFLEYANWMNKTLGGNKFSPIKFRKSGAYS